MANGISVGIQNSVKAISSLSVGISDSIKNIKEVYAEINGTPKLVWSAVTGNRLFANAYDRPNSLAYAVEISQENGLVINDVDQNLVGFGRYGGIEKRLFKTANSPSNGPQTRIAEVNQDILYNIRVSDFDISGIPNGGISEIGGSNNVLLATVSYEYGYAGMYSYINPDTFVVIKKFTKAGSYYYDGIADGKFLNARNSESSQSSIWQMTGVGSDTIAEYKILSLYNWYDIGGTTDRFFYSNARYRNTPGMVEISYSGIDLKTFSPTLEYTGLGGTK